MLFHELAKAFEVIESKSGRLEMTGLLAELFRKASPEEAERIAYITEGELLPPYMGVDMGMGEKFVLQAIAEAGGYEKKEVGREFEKLGDLGEVAEKLLKGKRQQSLHSQELTIAYVYAAMMKIAKASGTGSQDEKIKRLVELYNHAKPVEAKYITRFVLGQLRLGVGGPTILDALSVSEKGDKSLREGLDRAYNLCSDIGYVARIFKDDPKKIGKFEIEVFKPIMPALAERLSSAEEIIKKIGKCAVEQKYDGFRCISGLTPIYVKGKGFVSIHYVKEGDHVLTHKGRFRKVMAKNRRIIDKGERLFRIQTYFGEEFKISEGHKVLVSEKGKAKWVAVEKIAPGSFFVFPAPELRISEMPPPILELGDSSGYRKTIKVGKRFYRFLGFWIGDGFTNDYHNTERIGLIMNKKEKEFLDRYEKIVKEELGVTEITRSEHNGAIYLYWRDKPFRIWLSRNFRREWKGKMLPEWFFNVKKEYFEEFLKGWIESDGYTDKLGRTSIITKEGDLAMFAQLCSLKHGIAMGVRRFQVKRKTYYRLTLPKNDWKIRNGNNGVLVKILRLEQIKHRDPRTALFNLQVKGDESYCACMAALHNCAIHKKGDRVEIFSRRLERITPAYPDVVKAAEGLKPKEMIFEGEALAYNEKEKKFYSFQETMHRRRKHGVEAAKEKYPLQLFVFDLHYLDGKDYTQKPYSERREALEKVFPRGMLKLSGMKIIDSVKEMQEYFDGAVGMGLEGLIAKDLNAPYTAGKRKFAWIKLKKSYGKEVDTVDALIVGYYRGKGARTEFGFGGLLVAVLNEKSGKYETIAKVGSGFTEEEMEKFAKELGKMKEKEPPKDLEYRIEPDFWVKPKIVVEIAYDNITKSPTHTCGEEDGKGFALRFPRLIRIRDDKGPKEVTTTKEVKEMYKESK